MKTLLIALPLLIATIFGKAQNQNSPVNYIDSRIGTYNDNSQCVIGPQLPFGSINPSPQTPDGEHDGYNPDRPVRGFGQLHASGTGWGKYGQIFVSPQIGLAIGENEHDSPKLNETAHPYEYGVTLSRYNIRTEVTPSHHAAIYRFVFPESQNANILIDLSHNIPHDIAPQIGGTISQGTISIEASKSRIYGFGKYSGGFGEGDYLVYFTATFSRTPKATGTWINKTIRYAQNSASVSQVNDSIGAFLSFQTKPNDTVYMKIAVSFKSIDRAGQWLAEEIPGWDFEKVKASAKDTWDKQMAKINIETDSDTIKKIFYTALYHAMLMPRNRTSDMTGFDDGLPLWDDHYAVWDTWRSVFPLMSLINPDMVAGNINSFVQRFKVNKRVHDAYIAGNDMAEEQGGNNIDNIIADAYVKGIPGVDWEQAYSVIKYDADHERAGWQGWKNFNLTDPVQGSYKKQGWIPAGIMSCSKSLEYSYNDYCASLMAKGLGKTEDAQKYATRSHNWIQLWNPDATSDGYRGFIVPKSSQGEFLPIDIKKNWGSWNNYFYEANSWTYSYFVPHQFPKLVWLAGSKDAFAQKLNYAFQNNLVDYSNEPAFLAVYSFIYAGRPDLASYWARKLMVTSYSLTGYPGNDDSGAMSSWYVFNTLGLFPNAGQDIYYLTGALCKKATLSLANGKQLIIEAENASKANLYVQSCTINGKAWNKAWIRHKDISNGAVIKFVMGPKPSGWAQQDESIDYKPEADNGLQKGSK